MRQLLRTGAVAEGQLDDVGAPGRAVVAEVGQDLEALGRVFESSRASFVELRELRPLLADFPNDLERCDRQN